MAAGWQVGAIDLPYDNDLERAEETTVLDAIDALSPLWRHQVLGRSRDIQGAVLGGFIIGFIQQLSDNRDELFGFFPLGSAWTPAVVFAYLILIMVFKPSGLLGEQTRDAG